MRRMIEAALLAAALLLNSIGCTTVAPGENGVPVDATPALVKVMEYRQVYDLSLVALQIAINTGAIKDPATVKAIGEVRQVIEAALDTAEADARAGKELDAREALRAVEAALLRYAELTRPVPAARPIGRIPPLPPAVRAATQPAAR